MAKDKQIGMLIPIEDRNGRQAVSARMLHVFLESKKDFSDWIKFKVNQCDLVENQDYEVLHPKFGEQKGRGGHNKIEYALTIDAAKEISMVEGNERGKQARRYFIECERQLKATTLTLPNFANPAEAARAWAEQYELKQAKIYIFIDKDDNHLLLGKCITKGECTTMHTLPAIKKNKEL